MLSSFDAAANLGFFLLEKVGSIYGTWKGRMPADEQRALFGRFLGKGRLTIDGSIENIKVVTSACFGLDYNEVNHPFHTLGTPTPSI